MLEMLNEYDWRHAFECGADGFTIEDVAEVFGFSEGKNDGPYWKIYGRLNDGRFFVLSAGCDYTGWDCQASGWSNVNEDLSELIRVGMGDEERDVFGL